MRTQPSLSFNLVAVCFFYHENLVRATAQFGWMNLKQV